MSTVPAKSLFSLGAKVLTKLDSSTPTGFRVSKIPIYSIVQYKETLDLYNYIFTVNVSLFCKKARNWVACLLIKTRGL